MKKDFFKKKYTVGIVLFVCIVLPYFLGDYQQGLLLNILSQMSIWIIFALSYNLLLGQMGLLSFGHAVYFGLGGLATIHLLNQFNPSMIALNSTGLSACFIVCLPLVSGLFAALGGAVLGYLNTKQSGTAFAMISLAFVELVFAAVLILPGFFGGESGISANRVLLSRQPTNDAINFSSNTQVYYLMTAWCILSMLLMWLLTRTPLGYLARALKDNPTRVQAIAYNPHHIRWYMFIIASFFAGVAGALSVLNFEVITTDAVSVRRSGEVLLATVIGGTQTLFGAAIGAVVWVLCSQGLSFLTKAWTLYLGLLFILIVLFSPDGLIGFIQRQTYYLNKKLLFNPVLIKYYMLMLISSALIVLSTIVLIEMLYFRTLDRYVDFNNHDYIYFFDYSIDTSNTMVWVFFILFNISSMFIFKRAKYFFNREYHQL